jgi:hypothetical protein
MTLEHQFAAFSALDATVALAHYEDMTKRNHVFASARSARGGSHTAVARDLQLTADLSTYTSQADLAELSEILRRHPDAQAEPVRALVDLTAAA